MDIKTMDKGRRHTRELWLEPETRVSSLVVIDYTMRIGSVEVAMAGIGGVNTQYEHRMKDYMRTLFEDSVHYMMDHNYDVSMLFGIENFYTKFGYASSLASSKFSIKTRDAEATGPLTGDYGVHPIRPEDMPALLALYNAHNATRTGSIVRDAENFPKFQASWHGNAPETLLWENQAGKMIGYMVWDKYPKAVEVIELESWDAALFPRMLATLAEQAINKRCEEINVHMPPDHPFGEYAQRYGVKWTVTYPRNGGGMMRILNQQALFEKLIPELEQRLATSPLAGYSGALELRTDLGDTTLTFEDGTLKVNEAPVEKHLTLSQDKLMQLLCGYRSARDVCNDSGVSIAGGIEFLLRILFPKTFAYPWRADHF